MAINRRISDISVWGNYKWMRYEVMALPALNSCFFSKDAWVHYGATSPFEFTPANNIAVAARLDFFPVQGLRLRKKESLTPLGKIFSRDTLNL
jgi:hypothetical protein